MSSSSGTLRCLKGRGDEELSSSFSFLGIGPSSSSTTTTIITATSFSFSPFYLFFSPTTTSCRDRFLFRRRLYCSSLSSVSSFFILTGLAAAVFLSSLAFMTVSSENIVEGGVSTGQGHDSVYSGVDSNQPPPPPPPPPPQYHHYQHYAQQQQQQQQPVNEQPAASAGAGGGAQPQKVASGSGGAQHHHHVHDPSTHVEKVLMARHSWDSPLTFDNHLEDWILEMATVPAKQYVVLTPQVANRTGQFWNAIPVKTANFEISFTFHMVGGGNAVSEGFAFWYVYDNFKESFPKTPEGQRMWNLLGYRNNPNGLGVFFSCLDRTGKLNPSISAVMSDGKKVFNAHSDIPTTDGIYYAIRNTAEPLSFRLAVGPKGIVGEIRTSSTSGWLTCFRLLQARVVEGGFVGFTAFTGSDERTKVSDLIVLHKFHMYNLDLTQPGEDAAMMKETMGDLNVGDLLRDHSHFKDQHEHTEALKQLTRMLFKHTSEQAPREIAISKSLGTLSSQIQKLIGDVKELRREMQSISGHNNTDVMHSVKSELSGLKNLFHRHSQHHANTLHSLSSKVETIGGKEEDVSQRKEIRELVERAATLEKTINSKTYLSSWIALGGIIVLAVFGLFVWKRFRDMEKKHYL